MEKLHRSIYGKLRKNEMSVVHLSTMSSCPLSICPSVRAVRMAFFPSPGCPSVSPSVRLSVCLFAFCLSEHMVMHFRLFTYYMLESGSSKIYIYFLPIAPPPSLEPTRLPAITTFSLRPLEKAMRKKQVLHR